MGQHADITTLARQAAGRRMTGSVEVHPRALSTAITLYFYEGRLYALHGDGCEPPIVRRLLATGVLDAATAERMLANADGSQAEVGKAAVRAGLLPVERLAALHQEFLLAAFGALSAAGDLKAATHDGARTSAFCALPAPVDDIVATVQARAARTAGAWQSVTGDPHFQDRELLAGDGVIALTIPEADAIRAAVRAEGVASIDSVAHTVGLTRAEAVHLVAQLVHGGELVIGGPVEPAVAALVPESLLDPRPQHRAEPVKPAKTQRRWFRRHGAAESSADTATADDTAETDAVEITEITEMAETAEQVEQAESVEVASVSVVEMVDAVGVASATVGIVAAVEIEEIVAEAIPLVIDPAAGSASSLSNGNGWHHEPASDAPTTTVVRAVDSELIEAVYARLDHLVTELDDLRTLLRKLEAQT